jgi:hypothetical protein
MRQLSDEYGFEYVPAHQFNPDLTDELQQLPDSKAHRASKRGAHTGRIKWSRAAARQLGQHLSETLDRGATADDLEQLADSLGLLFEAKGGGYVLGNADGYATLSSLGLQKSAHGFERKRGPSLPAILRDNGRRWFDVDKVDITRAFMAWGITDKDDVKQAIKDVQAERAARRAPENSTALSTLTKASPPRPLKRTLHTPASRHHIQKLIARQTDRAAIAEARLSIARRADKLPGARLRHPDDRPQPLETNPPGTR